MGFMGSGKSIIGKDLSKYLNLKFYDTDKEIELKTKQKISEIFEEGGESYFRNIEEKVCVEILTNDNCVISLGGGAFLNKSIRRAVKNTSVSFWLDVEVNELIKRLKRNKKRPLLYNKNLNEIVNKIYLERKRIYNESDFRIKCKFLKREAIVDKIIKLYEKSRKSVKYR